MVRGAMLAAWTVLVCAVAAGAFNVDVDSCTRFRGSRSGSMFGFTVQEHVENGQKWVLVGAPEDDGTRRRPGVTRPGAVYRCDIRSEGPCSEVIFDRTGNSNDTNARQIDQKSNQWFGATLTSTGVDGPIVACAPRYVSYVSAKLNQRAPVGTCFVARNSFSEVSEYSPCRTSSSGFSGYDKTGVCQAGFGAAVSKDGSRLFMGAPGSWYWQGQMYSQNLNSRPLVLATAEGSPKHDDSYLGYSVAGGDFAGQGSQGVAVGMPRGSELRGKVVMYTWDLVNIKNISGSQIGGYFGYSVASGDIDGDGLDDLVVGAPMYTVPNNEGSFEQGRVYVIYQGRQAPGQRPFKLNDYRTGEVSRGRFGLSLASLGDINMDTYGDFAVGAPYGGANGRGVVYIYNGGSNGVREKYSQAITAEEVAPSLTTFGFSLSGGIDLDDNTYTDMAVGAYKSDMAVFFKSRPVVTMIATVQLKPPESREIALEDTSCTLRSGLKVACMEVEYCLLYIGINVETRTADGYICYLEFDVFLNLDSKQTKTRRLRFLNDESSHTFNQTVLLVKNETWCGETKIYIVNDVRDKLTPLEVSMEYNLKSDRYGRRDYIPPVLDLLVGNTASDAVNISKNCGADNVCVPDLKMHVEPSVTRYLLGSQEKLGINVFIENGGEDAFEASFYLHIPRGIHFVKTERRETGRSEMTSVHCSAPVVGDGGNTTLRCDIGNPLPSQQMVNFKVVLQPYDIDTETQKYVFDLETNSTNAERGTRGDNTHRLEVGVWVDTNVSIVGLSIPPDLHYNASQYSSGEENVTRDTELGPHVVHAYNVKNNGPSFIDEAELFLIWPYQTLAGENLFYMLTQPETSGGITCEMADHVNDQHFIIERRDVLFLPQIIQGVLANELAANKTESFISEAERRRIEEAQNKYSGQRQPKFSQGEEGSETSYEQRQHAYNSGVTQQGSWNRQGASGSAGRNYDGSSNQYGASSQRGSSANQYGSSSGRHESSGQFEGSSGQYSGSTGQYAGTSGQNAGSSRQYSGSSGQYAGSSGQSAGSSGQYAGSSGQYAGSSGQYAGSSGQYAGSSGQYAGSSGQYAGSSGQRGSVNGQGVVGGGGHREYNIYKERNTSVTVDEQGHVYKNESSTEYGDLGHEGEAGSSWNNREGKYYSGSSQHGQGRAYNQNQQSGSSGVNRSGYVGVGGGGYVGGHNLGWSTEESVNKNLFNAGSRTFVQGSVHGGSAQSGSEIEEVVGGEEEAIGGFASVAGNPDNEFRTVWSDVSDESAKSDGRGTSYTERSYGSGAYSGGAASGAYSGKVASGAAYSGGASGAAYGGSGQAAGRGSQSSYSASHSYGGAAQSGSAYQESRQFSSSSGASYSSESSVGSGRPAQYQQWGRRSRRQSDYLDYDKDLALVLANCTNNFKCAMIRCVTGPMQKNHEVWVSLRGRINAKFLNKMSKDREVLLTTVAAARVSKLPYMGRPTDAALTTFQAATHVTPQLEAPSSGAVPLWVVVLAAVAGALLLLLLILLLYKCGFFKRNRPSEQAERQPLNRHGYGHGDEQL